MRHLQKFLLATFILLLILFPQPVVAQENEISKNFDIAASVRYQVGENGNTRISQNIVITNKAEFVYIPSYSITIAGKGISNISVSDSTGNIAHAEKDEANRKTITVTFPEKIVGVGKKNAFTFSYDSDSIAKKTGSVWRVYIPAVSKNNIFSTYSVIVDVPRSFGSPTIIKPYVETTPGATQFTFTPTDLGSSGISMVFGQSQIYNFKLSYNLENKNLVPVRTEIALPPNTAYQNVEVNSLTPAPTDVYKDRDGNYLATYLLPGKTKMKVTARVAITSFATPQSTSNETELSQYLAPQKYWDVRSPEIKKLAQEYNTPQEIYDYVVSTLSYSQEKSGSNNKRVGAAGVLKNPSYAVCLEFTDLFIAMARSAGIPARAVEGYAYTSDEVDQPVSLFEDVLHSWPEYYDKERKQWIMVDPTWGNTTRGVDYFNTFDFDHVAFAINGLDSEYPVPAGGYKSEEPSRDIEVSFGSSTDNSQNESYTISGDFPSVIFSQNPQGELTVRNTGGKEIESVTTEVFLDGKKNIDVTFEEIPPFGKKTLSVELQNAGNELLLTSPEHVISINNNVKTVFTKKVYIIPLSYWYLIGGGVFLAAATVFVIALKTGGLHFQKRTK